MRGFRYALEPVRLTRQWALDALMVELADANVQLAAAQLEADRLAALAGDAEHAWRALGEGGQAMPADCFAQVARYLADCRLRQQAQADKVDAAVQLLADLQEQVGTARRGLDAVEEHRAQARQGFVRQRQDGDIKLADEQWSVLMAGREKHDDND